MRFAVRSSLVTRDLACGVLCAAALGLGLGTGCSSNGSSTAENPATGTAGTKPSGSGGNNSTSGTSGGSNAVRSGTGGSGGNHSTAGTGGSTAGSSGSPAGTGGSSGSGGTAGTSMRMDAGVDASMADEDAGPGETPDAGECKPLDRPLNVAGYPKCSKALCPAQDSVCVKSELLTQLKIPESTTNLLADCDDVSKCVPVSLASEAGRAILPKCTSLLGAEGRCVSPCVPQVAQQASQLPKDVCEGTDLCAPCYDPRTGEATGACSQGCDKGPTEEPKTFAHCCSNRGLCVPPVVAGDQAKNLDQDTCGQDLLCAPTELTDPTFKPKACSSIDNAEGRCISTCVGGAVAKQRDRLPTKGCGQDEVCAPCYDPVTGEDTGACRVNGDEPLLPPYRFDSCCDGNNGPVGVCVPPELAGSQASILRQESCASGKLCAPIKKAADPAYQFPRCFGVGTGACVPQCIVDPSQAAILNQGQCQRGELCAPCDLLGSPTGACE